MNRNYLLEWLCTPSDVYIQNKLILSYPETISLREVISFHVIKPLLSFSEQMLVLVSPARRSVNFGEAVFRYTNAQILLWLRMPIDVDHRLQTTSQLSHYSVGASPDRVSV